MKTRIIHLCMLFCLAAGLGQAQQLPQAHIPAQDPLIQNFFPPELVIQNQTAIGLTDEQRSFFRTEIRDAQTKFTDLQWKLQDEAEKMMALVKQPHVDEQQAVAQLEKVLAVEREIKRGQVAFLIRLKNKLTPEQQAKLEDIRSQVGK